MKWKETNALVSAPPLGSVFWYFVLLNYVKEEDLAGCSTACASLLTAVSRQLQDRLTPLEALLQTRYCPLGSTSLDEFVVTLKGDISLEVNQFLVPVKNKNKNIIFAHQYWPKLSLLALIS